VYRGYIRIVCAQCTNNGAVYMVVVAVYSVHCTWLLLFSAEGTSLSSLCCVLACCVLTVCTQHMLLCGACSCVVQCTKTACTQEQVRVLYK